MTLTTILDGEKIVGTYLREHADVVAAGARVVGQAPRNRETPWVRVTQLDASTAAETSTDYFVEFLVQFDCYSSPDGIGGSQQAQASLVARTVRAVLHAMPAATISGAVVTCVKFVGMLRLPDTDFEPARERIVLTANIYMHVG